MGVISLGLKKIYIAPVDFGNTTMPNKNTSTADPTTDWVDLGDVYEDSATLTDADAQKTIHKSETSSKKIVCSKPGDCTLQLQLMDPNLTELQRLFGGTISGTTPNQKWTRPSNYEAKPFALWVVPQDGFALKCACTGITPKLNITYNAQGIMLLDVAIDLMHDVVFDEDASDPLYHAS